MASASLAPASSSGMLPQSVTTVRTGLAVDEKLAPGAGRSGDDAIVEAVVIGERLDADKRFFAGAIGGQNIDEDHVVVDGKGGNGSAVVPDQVVLAPTFAIALEGEIRVVSNDIAVDKFHAFLHERVGQRFQSLNGIVVALGLEIVGKFASGEIGIAVADEDEISVQTAVAVERTGGFDGGAELVVGPDQRQRGSGGEELGVRSGRKEFVGVVRVQRFARRLVGRFVGRATRDNFDSPEAAGQIGSAEDSGNAIRAAGLTGAASSGATSRRTMETRPATDRRRSITWIVTSGKNGFRSRIAATCAQFFNGTWALESWSWGGAL